MNSPSLNFRYFGLVLVCLCHFLSQAQTPTTLFALNKCDEVLTMPVKFVNQATQIAGQAKTVHEASLIAKSFGILFTKKFLELPAPKKLAYLNGVNRAVSKVPPLVKAVIDRAGFRLYLAVDSVGNDPRFKEKKKDYPKNSGTRGLCFTNKSGRWIGYVVNNNIEHLEDTPDYVVLHEFGHAYDRALKILLAKAEKNDPRYDPVPRHFFVTDPELSEICRAEFQDRPQVCEDPYYVRELFADMFSDYYNSDKTRNGLKRRPEKYRFMEKRLGPSSSPSASPNPPIE